MKFFETKVGSSYQSLLKVSSLALRSDALVSSLEDEFD